MRVFYVEQNEQVNSLCFSMISQFLNDNSSFIIFSGRLISVFRCCLIHLWFFFENYENWRPPERNNFKVRNYRYTNRNIRWFEWIFGYIDRQKMVPDGMRVTVNEITKTTRLIAYYENEIHLLKILRKWDDGKSLSSIRNSRKHVENLN